MARSGLVGKFPRSQSIQKILKLHRDISIRPQTNWTRPKRLLQMGQTTHNCRMFHIIPNPIILLRKHDIRLFGICPTS